MVSKKIKFSIVLLLSLIITTGFMIGCAGNKNKADDKQKTEDTIIDGKKMHRIEKDGKKGFEGRVDNK
ncbi:hypothetical protein HA909_002650 [Enterococcus faecalis]|nr:hypothetical protein [Enterococcus faecalis]